MKDYATILHDHLKDPEFAKDFFKQELILAITEAVCETLNSYGFIQNAKQPTSPADTEEPSDFDGVYYIKYIGTDRVQLTKCR